MEPHHIALLGAGGFAIGAHLPAIAATDTLHLVAVWSRSLSSVNSLVEASKKHASTAHDLSVYSEDPSTENLDALLARSDIQTVAVALPIPSQPAIIERAWRAGKNVISEKPVAPSLEEAKKLVDLYEREYKPRGLLWIVAEQMAHMQSFEKARQIIADGKIGELRSFQVEVYIQPSVAAGKTTWRTVPDYQGGYVLDGGVHFAAGLRHMIPHPITSLYAHYSQIQPHLPPCDTLTALVTATPSTSPNPAHSAAPTSLTGTFHLTFGTEAPSSTRLYTFRGSKGVLTLDFGQARIHTLKLVNFPSSLSAPPSASDPLGTERNEEPHELTIELPAMGVEDEFEAFGKALVAGAGSEEAKDVERRSGPRATMRDLGFIEGGLLSSKKGKAIDLVQLVGEEYFRI
ncbi:hypothetical protein JCM10213_000947 [Rhodosporidiobolus nylandii]